MGKTKRDPNISKLVMSGRVDVRAVATVAKWMDEEGYMIDSMSWLLNQSIITLARSLAENKRVSPVKDYNQAFRKLDELQLWQKKTKKEFDEKLKSIARDQHRQDMEIDELLERAQKGDVKAKEKVKEMIKEDRRQSSSGGGTKQLFASPDPEAEKERVKKQMDLPNEEDIETEAEGTHDEIAGLPSQSNDD